MTTRSRQRPPGCGVSSSGIYSYTDVGEAKGLVSHARERRAYLFSPTKSADEVSAWYAGGRFRELIDRFGDLAVAVFVEQVGEVPIRYQLLRQLVEGNDERGGP